VKAPPLSYVRAATLSEAFQLWRDAGPDARLLAGGQSLLASLAFRLSAAASIGPRTWASSESARPSQK
jgi:CO/xanthine dehydrogenase FAD-binding subunit